MHNIQKPNQTPPFCLGTIFREIRDKSYVATCTELLDSQRIIFPPLRRRFCKQWYISDDWANFMPVIKMAE